MTPRTATIGLVVDGFIAAPRPPINSPAFCDLRDARPSFLPKEAPSPTYPYARIDGTVTDSAKLLYNGVASTRGEKTNHSPHIISR